MTTDKPIKSTEQGFDCCKRYYYYGKHNYKCRQINNLKEDEQIPLFPKKETN